MAGSPDVRAVGPGACRPYRPRTRLSVAWAQVVNQLSRPRAPYDGRIENLPLRLAIEGVSLDGGDAPPDTVEIVFGIGDGARLGLALPEPALGRIARAIQPDLDGLPPGSGGALLLELALAPLLGAAETILGRRARIEGVAPPGRDTVGPILAIAATLAGERFPARLRLGPPSRAPGRDVAALLRLVEAAAPRPAPVDRLPVVLTFGAGAVGLTRAGLGALELGDAILPDVWHPERDELVLTLGERFAATAALDQGTARLKGPFRASAHAPAQTCGARMGTGMAADDNGRDAPNLDALGVTLTFELARRTVAVGELKAVGAGHVFDLGLDPTGPVELRVDGVRIGRGEIVEVGERLGIRVVRLFGDGSRP